jgi:hypothetical protein
MFDDLLDKTDDEKLRAFEKTIEEGLRTFTDVGSALLQIRDGKLYHPHYNSFEDYCREKWDMDHSHAYRLMNSAQVVENLKSSPIGELLPANEAQARPLASLPLEQQAEAWNKAVDSAPKGKNPSAGLVRKIVDRFLAKAGKEKHMDKLAEGWTTVELKKDTDLFNAFKSIALVYGNDDTKAIRTGIVQIKRADVIFLAKLSREKMREIRDLIFANRWTPKEAVRFVNAEPDDDYTVGSLKNLCLSTEGKFWSHEFHGFTITVKLNRAIARQ